MWVAVVRERRVRTCLLGVVTFVAFSFIAYRSAILAADPNPKLLIDSSEAGIIPYKERKLLQDIVTWDSHSFFVRGERILIYSGEFHPFRYVLYTQATLSQSLKPL
jgi:hypothetical protein